MLKKLTSIRNILLAIMVTVLLFVVTFLPGISYAATLCNQSGSIIGEEWVAIQCIPEGMDDSTSILYLDTLVTCSGSSVSLFSPNGDTQLSPANIIGFMKSLGYRVFRNKEGSHIVAVHSNYTGLIDGKNMSSYATGQVYTDVFNGAFILPNPPPKCKSKPECNSCPCPTTPIGSTADLATGALSHSQELFALKGGLQPLAISLDYNSAPFAPSAIGNGWSHSYELTLEMLTNGSVKLWDKGQSHLFRLYSGTYTSPAGNYSTLVKNGDGSYTVTEKDGFVRNFDSTGHVTSLVDLNGNSTTFTYTSGKLTGVTDPGGRIVTFSYDGAGKLDTIKDPKLNTYTFIYTGGKLTKLSLPGGGEWNYTYAANGLLQSKNDPLSNITSYGYDSGNRVTSGTDPKSQTRSVDYVSGGGNATRGVGKVPDPYPRCENVGSIDPNNPIVSGSCEQTSIPVTEKNGEGWNYEYDYASNTLKSKTDPYGSKTSYLHDANGQVLAKTEPGVGTTWYSYDSKGNVLTVKNPLNQTTTNTYNGFGQLLTSSGPEGNSSNTYYANGNLQTVTDRSGATTSLQYDTRGNLSQITDANTKVTSFTYRADNQIETIIAPDGTVTAFTQYDSSGNNTEMQIKDINGTVRKTVAMVYDGRNRLHTSTTTVTGQPAITTTYDYDANDNPNYIQDPEGNETRLEYNYNHQQTKSTQYLINGPSVKPVVTNYQYGASSCPTCNGGVDKLTAVIDAKNQSTGYQYDKVSRLEYETDPLGKKFHYTYFANGKVKEKYDATVTPETLLVTYGYNSIGQLTGKQYADGTSETYTYDSGNRLKTVTNQSIGYTYDYYSSGAYLNRLKSITDSNGRIVSYDQYDNRGQKTQVTIKDGADQRTITYQYDTANRPWKIISVSGPFEYLYDELGRRKTTSYPNGTTATYSYDELDRLTELKHAAGTTTIALASYTDFDKTGNRKTKTTGSTPESYLYDTLYRLLTVTGDKAEAFQFDDVGNRTTGPGVKDSSYSYNAANQVVQGRKLHYDYDNAGNQTSKTIPSVTDKTWVQTWDLENRLVKVEKTKGTEKRTVTFKYDSFGRRVEKQLTTVIDGVTKQNTWQYVYDNDNITLEIYTDENNSTEKTWFTHGANVDEHLALERNGQSNFFHQDGLGSVISITNASAVVVQSYEYDSFGMVKPSTSFRDSYTYTGREWDKEAGLYYYRARYYDPMEGRFISRDPISFAGGINLYNYVQNNPVNLTDPSGLVVSQVWRPLSSGLWSVQYHTAIDINGRIFGFQNGKGVVEENPGDYKGWGYHSKVLDASNNSDDDAMKFVQDAMSGQNPSFTKDTYFLPNKVFSGKSCINFVDCLASKINKKGPCK